VLTTLAHHIDLELMHEAYRLTRKDGAVGVDGKGAADFAANLEDNLRSLLERLKSGTYHAPPVRRVHIPKGDGRETRPIGIPTFEDKVLQRAVAMVLGAVYEQDFLSCSYGFRPGRSAHHALDELWQVLMRLRGGWVVEVDIRSFFDNVDHGHLRGFLDQRVRDGVLRRAIDKWLKAGVLEDGAIWHPENGTPQGGVISPLLANILLHGVLDEWFDEVVRPRLKAHCQLIRYADDFVVVFAREDDARRVMDVLPKRFGRYGLALHPEKTRLVEFRRPRRGGPGRLGVGRRSFDLLGFTHFWALSLKGNWVVRRKTSSARFRRALKRIAEWCRYNRHAPLAEQHAALAQKLNGHYSYYGITGNGRSLKHFLHRVGRAWRKWLGQRSQRARMTMTRFMDLLQRYPLPPARAVHSVYRPAANP
jgi:group II intron reverse transcriptase/maturase